MELWHEPIAGESSRLATRVDIADSLWSKMRGRMFTRSMPEETALVFSFESVGRRSVHMVAVPYPLDVIWLQDEEVTKVRTLRPLVGIAWGHADTIVEVPAGVGNHVEPGDRLVIER